MWFLHLALFPDVLTWACESTVWWAPGGQPKSKHHSWAI